MACTTKSLAPVGLVRGWYRNAASLTLQCDIHGLLACTVLTELLCMAAALVNVLELNIAQACHMYAMFH